MTMVRKPFDELMALPRFVDRMLDESWLRPGRWLMREFELPAIDVRITDDNLEIKAALPGVEAKDVDIAVEGDVLTIKGSFGHEDKKEETGYVYQEMSRGEFTRAIALPVAVRAADAKATFKDGVLTLTLPKTVPVKPQKVAITTT